MFIIAKSSVIQCWVGRHGEREDNIYEINKIPRKELVLCQTTWSVFSYRPPVWTSLYFRWQSSLTLPGRVWSSSRLPQYNIQLILINCRFCICEFDYFLKFICNPKREAGERREEKTAQWQRRQWAREGVLNWIQSLPFFLQGSWAGRVKLKSPWQTRKSLISVTRGPFWGEAPKRPCPVSSDCSPSRKLLSVWQRSRWNWPKLGGLCLNPRNFQSDLDSLGESKMSWSHLWSEKQGGDRTICSSSGS